MRGFHISIALLVAIMGFGTKSANIEFLIVSGSDGRPVKNAEIDIQHVDSHGRAVGESIQLKTHDDGKMDVKNIPYGKTQVRVLAPGFKTFNKTYTINQADSILEIKIQKAREATVSRE